MSLGFWPVGRVLLVGGGNMGVAMARGWVSGLLSPAELTVVDPKPGVPLEKLIELGVRHSSTVPAEAFDVVLIAVKPQIMPEVLPSLAPAMGSKTLIVTVAAGKTIAAIEDALGPRAVVRAMPNTPALIGRGVTGAYPNERVSEAQHKTADALLSACGAVEWVRSEAEIDLVTGVSGSGPAYVFYLAEALAAAGVEAGLEPDLALRLARHTVAGAGELMIRSEEEPAQLRRNVTSPNGTTQAALDVLMATDGLEPLMKRAVFAAADRARAFSKD